MFTRGIKDELIERLNDVPAVGLVGPRQVGKTTLAQQIKPSELGKETIYLDLESDDDQNQLRNPERFLTEHQDQLVVIDEIQRSPTLFPLLRSLIDRHRQTGRFLLLGSASPALMQSSSETLAGRISFLELHPLSFQEVTPAIPYSAHWLRGGFPNMLQAPTDRSASRRSTDFIRTYSERDLPLLGLPAAPTVTRNLLSMLVGLHGNLLNVSDLSRSLGVSVPTVQRYLDFLENAFLIRRLQPYFINVVKRITRSPKIYIRDSGLLHALAGIGTTAELYRNLLVGSSWEGYVIQQIITQLDFNVQPYFYRTQDGSELDLVLVRGTKPFVGIEVKYSNTPSLTKGTTISQQDLGNIPVLVVTPNASDFWINDRTRVCSIQTVWQHLAEL